MSSLEACTGMQCAGITKGKKAKPEAVYQTRVDSWRNKKQHLYPAYFTLKDKSHPFLFCCFLFFSHRCWLYRDRAITEQYPLLIGIPIWAESNIPSNNHARNNNTLWLSFPSVLSFFFPPNRFLPTSLPVCLERTVTSGALDFSSE